LTPVIGTGIASALFAVALLCSGQSSTITGTLAGQIVMEGFVNVRLPPALRRVLTRGIAIVPAVVVLAWAGESGTLPLLVASQVVLSLQLPFAIVQMIRFTSSSAIMGRSANSPWIKWLAVACALLVISANLALVGRSVLQWREQSPLLAHGALLLAGVVFSLLLWISVVPLCTARGGVHATPAPA
jgi:manganese transport protein